MAGFFNFQKRHYDRLARLLREERQDALRHENPLHSIDRIADKMAVMFENDNPKFSRGLWFSAVEGTNETS